MRRCTRCLYPETRPDLHFDEAGVCSACRAYERRDEIDWAERRHELEAILETGRNDSGYDCIVPSSGGKDSHWQVKTLIDLGAKPLVVTATTCHLTAVGRANIDNLARYATTIEVTPNRTVRSKLNRLALEWVGDISWPEHAAIFTTPFRAACDFGIPLVFYGECPQEAYGGPPGTEEAREMTLRWVQEFGGFLGLRPDDFVGHDGLAESNLDEYRPPTAERVTHVGVRAYWLGQFYRWDSHRNAETARGMGMTQFLPCAANWWPFENLDNAQCGLHDYGMLCKYGYGRATAQLSVDIRAGRISREEAAPIARECELTFPAIYASVPISDTLDRLGLSIVEFMRIMDGFRLQGAPGGLDSLEGETVTVSA